MRINPEKEIPKGFEKTPDNIGFFAPSQVPPPPSGRPQGMNRRPGGPGAMGRAIEKPKNTSEVVARLLGYFKNEKKLLLPLILIVIAVTVSMLFAPSMQGDAIDYITEKKWNSLYFVLGSMMALYIFQSVCTLFQTLLSAHLSQRIVRKMRHQLFKKIINLPIKYIDTHSNGDIMSRLTNDVENISNTISMSLGSLVSGVLTIVGTITIMLFKCWQLTLITLLTVVMTVFVTQNLSKVMRKIYKRRSVALGKLNGHSEEMITGYKTIASYNREKQVTDEFNKLSDDLCNVSMRAEVLGGSMGPIMNCISNISFVIVAAFGGYFALSGIISIGTISAFIIYSKQFSRPINEIAMLYGSLQTALAGAERVFELIDNPDETDGGQNTLENIKGEVSFKNVDFSYIPGKQVLHDFSLDVKPGQKIALVGATGSGKTTVVNLLMRFYNTDSGEILIDGVNINDIQMDELRKNIAIVLQDTVLFSDTIGNNIKYSDMNASDDIMYDAASMSNSAYFIERLPDGYNTFLTQAGANISQGQRQLLAIARAILADPKILILDEATSSVDTRTEKHIQNAMVKLMENRTSLIIAHRLSTIRDSDKIVVMDNGRVVETGTHDQLLELKEKYYRLYITQFAGNEI